MPAPVDWSRVPEALRSVAPWAQRFAIADSVERSEALKATTLAELQQFVVAVAPCLEPLHSWTDGAREPSAEQYALTYLAAACEEAMGEIVIHPTLQARIDLAKARLLD